MSAKQKGFGAVELILIFVAIGIVGFAGWFVWNSQRQINKTLDDSNKINTAAPSVNDPERATSNANTTDTSLVPISVEGGHATVGAPKNWKVTNGDANDQAGLFAAVKITSPDSNISVTFARLGGLGGYCDPTDGYTMTKLKVTPLINTPSLSYVEYLRSDSKMYKMSVTPTAKAAELRSGASVCDAYLDEVMDKYMGYAGNAVFSISYKPFEEKIGDSMSTAKPISETEYKTLVNSADYQIAKNILSSLKY